MLLPDRQFFLTDRQTLAIQQREAMLVKEIQLTAQPFVIVRRSLSGHDVPLRQPRLVATDEFRRDDEQRRIPELEGWR